MAEPTRITIRNDNGDEADIEAWELPQAHREGWKAIGLFQGKPRVSVRQQATGVEGDIEASELTAASREGFYMTGPFPKAKPSPVVQPSQPPGALARFGLAGGERAVELVKGLAVPPPIAMATQAPVKIQQLRELLSTSEEERRIAGESMRQESISELKALNPLSPKLLTEDIAGGLGETAVNLAPFFLPGPKVAKAEARLAGEAAALKTPIPLLPSERTLKSQYGYMEAAVGKTYGALPVFQRFRERQTAAVLRAADDIATDLSKFKGTPEELGRAIQVGRKEGLARLKEEAGAPYAEIDALTQSTTQRVPKSREVVSSLVDESGKPMSFEQRFLQKQEVGGVQPSTASLKKAAIPLLRRLRQQGRLMDPKLLADSESMLSGIIKAPKQLPFKVFQDTRSDLLAVARNLEEAIPGKRAGIAKMLEKETNAAMVEAAEKSSVPGLAKKVEAANTQYAELHRVFDQRLLEQIADTQKPEAIAGYMRGAGLQELRDLKKVIGKERYNDLAAQVLRDEIGKSMSGELTTAATPTTMETIGGIFSPTYPQQKFKGKDFQARIEGLGREKMIELFGTKGATDITNLANLTARMGPNAAGQGGSAALIAGLFNAATLSPLTSVSVMTIPQSAASLAGANLLARIMVRQGGANAMSRFLQAKSGTAAQTFWANRVATLANEEYGKMPQEQEEPIATPELAPAEQQAVDKPY